MTKMMVNGVEITTNYNGNWSKYPQNYDHEKTRVLCEQFGEGTRAMLERAVKMGYTRITFYYETTCIRGYHKFYAFCRDRKTN